MKKLGYLLCIGIFFVSCVSTNQESVNTEKPNFEVTKIDDYNIEISATENARYIYLCQYLGKYSHWYDAYYDFRTNERIDSEVKRITQNISFMIDGKIYDLKLDDEDDGLFKFVVIDSNGKKLQNYGNSKITLKSNRALSYTNAIAGTRLKIGDEEFGRKKYPFDCLISLNNLNLSEKTKAEQEKIDLARKIIVKKYGFRDSQDYISWLNRTNWNNLYVSLSAGSYSNARPFVEGDYVFMKENLLTIEDMSSTSAGYLYLVTAGKNQISKCCMVVSGHQLNYMNYYGAMITESLLLRYEGKNQYQQGYRSQSCDVFTVIERGSKEYNDYVTKINGISDIEKNPYAYSDILK